MITQIIHTREYATQIRYDLVEFLRILIRVINRSIFCYYCKADACHTPWNDSSHNQNLWCGTSPPDDAKNIFHSLFK